MKPDFIRKREKKVLDEKLPLEQEGVSISIRSIVIGLVLVALVTYASAKIQILPPRASMARSHFPWPPVFVLFALVFCVNIPLYILSRSLRLKPAELLTIFCMTFVSVAIPTYGLMIHFCTRLGGLSYIDKTYPESKLAETCGKYFSPSLEPTSWDAVKWFYEGLPEGQSIPWGAWITPLFMWFLFIGFMYMLFVCLATILSKQWIEYEKLPFAAAQVPLALAERDESDGLLSKFLKNKVVWLGFAIPFALHTYNSLASLAPDIPAIPIDNRNWAASYLTEPPWSALLPMNLLLFPTGIAFIFLISTEVSFSLLFFFVLLKVQVIIAYYLGYAGSHQDFIGPISYFTGQSAGALAVLALMGLWIGRAHIRDVFTRAFPAGQARVVFAAAVCGIALLRLVEWTGVFGEWLTPQMSLFAAAAGVLIIVSLMRSGGADDSRDIMPYRIVAVGLPLSVYGMARWCEIIGMSFWLAIFIVGILIVIAIAMTRLVAEGGVLHLKANVDPINLSSAAFGNSGLGGSNLTAMNTLQWGFMFEMPAFLMPAVMNSIKIGWDKRCSGRRFGAALILAIAVALVLSFYVYISSSYEMGAMKVWKYLYFNWTQGCWSKLCREIEKAEASPGFDTDWKIVSYVGLGAALMFVFSLMRQRFLWFVHPIGYIAWMSPYMMNRLWFPILVGWVLKTLIVKFGGHSVYEKVRPFFIGIIAGESVAITLWSIVQFTGLLDIKVNAFG